MSELLAHLLLLGKFMKKFFPLIICLALFITGCSSTEKENPKINKRVTDNTGTLTSSEVMKLEQKLEQHEKETSNQIAILIIPSLNDQAIETVSIKIVEKWKGGQKGKDNGLLLLIAKNDKKLRIETGYGFEHCLPDAVCKRIIDGEITPFFKDKNFYAGINNGLDKIFLAIKGEYTNTTRTTGEKQDIQKAKLLVLIAVAVLSIFGCFAHRLAGGLIGGIGTGLVIYWADFDLIWVILSALGGFLLGLISKELAELAGDSSSGSYRGSSGNSGSFSGGGGSFGGGGASGSW